MFVNHKNFGFATYLKYIFIESRPSGTDKLCIWDIILENGFKPKGNRRPDLSIGVKGQAFSKNDSCWDRSLIFFLRVDIIQIETVLVVDF